jgi:Short C-terminal domain
MGLFGFLRRKDESAMPDPDSPEFQALVDGSTLPGSAEMGEGGWTSVPGGTRSVDLRGTGAREEIVKLLRERGMDPDAKDQRIDASAVPGLRDAIIGILGKHGVQIPGVGGVGGYVAGSPQAADPLAQIEHLAKQRDAGQITEAEFQAQKRHLLGN